MAFEDLTQSDVLYGSLSLILVLVSTIVGLRIISKYFSYKEKTLLTVGLAWAFITSAWWVSAFQFIFIALFNYKFTPYVYLLIENAFTPFAIIFWIYSFCALMRLKSQKIIVSIYVVICALFEVILFTLLSINTELVGTGIEEGIFTSRLTDFFIGFQIFAILSIVITGIIFSRKSLQSEKSDIKWKGVFLLIAFLSIAFGAALEAIFLLGPLELILVRALLISGSIEFYFGFFLPKPIAKILVKE
ncbi:MAG: hypothetical protein ACFFDK_00465 [Promethearchaeota archaeon]